MPAAARSEPRTAAEGDLADFSVLISGKAVGCFFARNLLSHFSLKATTAHLHIAAP